MGREEGLLEMRQLSMISPCRGPGEARATPRHLTDPSYPRVISDKDGSIPACVYARQRRARGIVYMAQGAAGFPSAIRARRDGRMGRRRRTTIPPRKALKAHHHAEAKSAMDFWGRQANSGDVAGFRPHPPFSAAPEGHLSGT